MNNAQIEHMVNRFLSWKFPEDFAPDGGISFNKIINAGTKHAFKYEPSGTNLLDYAQAKKMVEFMIEGMPEDNPIKAKKPKNYNIVTRKA